MSAQGGAVAVAPKEIRGPSAFGGSPARFFHLVWMLAITEFRLTYFGSVLGYLWSLMRPLLMFGVLYVVFAKIAKFGADIPHYPALLLLNIVLLSFFTEATQKSVASVIRSENVVRKMQFPRLVIPLSIVLTAAIDLAVNLFAVLVFVVASGVHPKFSWLALPLILAPLVLFTVGVSMILAALYVRFRDLEPIWGVLSTVIFYGSPVLYVVEKIPSETFRKIAMCNPLGALLEQARRWVIDPSAVGSWDAVGGFPWVLIPVAIFVGVCAFGVWIFDHEAPRIAERL